ncbi:phosphoglycerate dehydrogenase [Fusibacillus kribbianus]|uniref:Phosphoglycerate dehydrogenase n=1 Tax=Fusibacillus kribbianus TaxID=3044208 RepID=A0AAP4BBU5_9FIRM|nr:phosphoglycerate dehydrogenase [Ruminococcus sp. YH-rum2234]MDI9241731.1 phosphoglycerate dehydrogenase [Ruminococcus sp. YH-rum2234]
MKILVTPTSMQPEKENPALDRLKEFADELVYNPTGKPLEEDALCRLLEDCDGYLAGLDFVTEKVLKSCHRLKAISRYGAGYDRVDLQAAKDCGIFVSNTPGANAEAVGELAFGMMMTLARRLVPLDRTTKAGGWVRSTGTELYGKTLGIVGLGAIGRVVARCAGGFGMHVIAYDPFIDEEYCKQKEIESMAFDDVMSRADFVTLHLPLLESTRHLVDRNVFASMKDGAILINASRGGIVDEDAALDALISGKLGGLGLDAFEEEPPAGSPLFAFDNVLATPHTGAHTMEATENMANMAVDNLIAMLSGQDCPYILNR